jgi:Domain of unknown function (DUF4397)
MGFVFMIYQFYRKKHACLIVLGCFLLAAFQWAACTKNINASANKAYLSVTNAVQGTLPVDVLVEGNTILPSGQPLLTGDTTTGFPGNPYIPVIAGIHNFRVTTDRINYLVDGNIALQTNQEYSVFLYDTIFTGKIHTLILQDQIPILPDTISGFRFLNLSPSADTLYYVLTKKNHITSGTIDTITVDTIRLGFIPYIGPNPVPSSYSGFSRIKSGGYIFNTASDTSNVIFDFVPIDSIYFAGGKSYTAYSTGFQNGSGSDTLKTRLLQHN